MSRSRGRTAIAALISLAGAPGRFFPKPPRPLGTRLRLGHVKPTKIPSPPPPGEPIRFTPTSAESASAVPSPSRRRSAPPRRSGTSSASPTTPTRTIRSPIQRSREKPGVHASRCMTTWRAWSRWRTGGRRAARRNRPTRSRRSICWPAGPGQARSSGRSTSRARTSASGRSPACRSPTCACATPPGSIAPSERRSRPGSAKWRWPSATASRTRARSRASTTTPAGPPSRSPPARSRRAQPLPF